MVEVITGGFFLLVPTKQKSMGFSSLNVTLLEIPCWRSADSKAWTQKGRMQGSLKTQTLQTLSSSSYRATRRQSQWCWWRTAVSVGKVGVFEQRVLARGEKAGQTQLRIDFMELKVTLTPYIDSHAIKGWILPLVAPNLPYCQRGSRYILDSCWSDMTGRWEIWRCNLWSLQVLTLVRGPLNYSAAAGKQIHPQLHSEAPARQPS